MLFRSLLPLRGLLVFPNTVVTIDAARDRSIAALQRAVLREDSLVFVVAQRDALVEHPGLEDLYTMGTVAQVRQIIHLPDNTSRVLLEGHQRGMLLAVREEDQMQLADVAEVALPAKLFTDAQERVIVGDEDADLLHGFGLSRTAETSDRKSVV